MSRTPTRRPILAAAAAASLAVLAACQGVTPHRHKGPLIVTPSACADFTVQIYFEAGSAALTHPAAAILNAAAARTGPCRVTGVDVVGLSDPIGDPAANLELSKRRANAVTLALHQRGLDQVEFKVAAAGEAGAQTPSGAVRPVRRRVDVSFRMSPKS
ncbi:MAG: OmpA family protein [Caulobacteraceae bacterium]|nr:OmpA family protein [Caulobacteraceae bacterium]